MIAYVQRRRRDARADASIPIHVLIETHGALRDAFEIAALPHVEVLDFGQMDFVSGHHGALPASAMRSPDQFEHALLVRAKAEVVAAAIGNGVVPAHNVSPDTEGREGVSTPTLTARARNSASCACGASIRRRSARSSKP